MSEPVTLGFSAPAAAPPPIGDRFQRIADRVESAPALGARPETPPGENPFGDEAGRGEDEADSPLPSPDGGPVDGAAVAACAGLDHSDTDNARRLIAHFGQDLAVLAQAKAKSPAWAVYNGAYWDLDHGGPAAKGLAQRVGWRIALEADFLAQTPLEEKAIRAAAGARRELDVLDAAMATAAGGATPEQIKARAAMLKTIAEGTVAKAALQARRQARRKFAVSSKNRARLEAMLDCAAPHLLRPPEGFNADPLLVATRAHTLRFLRERDDECPDPDVVRWRVTLEAREGHRREDFCTRLVPVTYDAAAACPRWDAFLARFLPDGAVRRFVQTYAGIGLLGLTVQRIVFHYGSGANGKSVFMETLMRVFGPLAVGLPAESITGDGQRGSGQASPDLARLYGARTLRVLELPADRPLHEDLIKKLTGGEQIPVRDLFAGYFDFTPVFSGHMSGNGYPLITGTDNGIWRRMAVVHWPVTLAPEEQREFEEVLADFAPEGSGILNWLIAGAQTFLAEGLVLPEAVRAATKDYRDEMDPVGEFAAACVEVFPHASVTAREMYQAYTAWCEANAKRPYTETKFGRVMKGKFRRDDSGSRHAYVDCALHDVPERPPSEAPRNPGFGWTAG